MDLSKSGVYVRRVLLAGIMSAGWCISLPAAEEPKPEVREGASENPGSTGKPKTFPAEETPQPIAEEPQNPVNANPKPPRFPPEGQAAFTQMFVDALKSEEVKEQLQKSLGVEDLRSDINQIATKHRELEDAQEALKKAHDALALQVKSGANSAAVAAVPAFPATSFPVANYASAFPAPTATGATIAVAAASANPTPAATKVHVILALHTGRLTANGLPNGIATGAEASRLRLRKLFVYETSNVPNNPAPVELFDTNFTHNSILQAIKNLPITNATQETVVLWIGCHGATDSVSGQHVLEVPGGTHQGRFVARGTYVNALKATGARQVVLLTDTCSNVMSIGVPPATVASAALNLTRTDLLSQLLVHQTGVFDIGGSRAPEFGAYYPNGSLFSEAFFSASLFATDVQVSQGWKGMIDACQERMNGPINFGPTMPPQAGQHPVPFPVN